MRIVSSLFALLAMLAAPAFAQQNQGPSEATIAFVREVLTLNAYEMSANQIALQKSTSNDVRAYAQTMINDHNQTGDRLKVALGASNAGTDAAITGAISADQQTTLTRLTNIRARYFNTLFANREIDSNAYALRVYSKYAESGDDDVLKKFAADMLPRIQQHLDQARKLK